MFESLETITKLLFSADYVREELGEEMHWVKEALRGPSDIIYPRVVAQIPHHWESLVNHEMWPHGIEEA